MLSVNILNNRKNRLCLDEANKIKCHDLSPVVSLWKYDDFVNDSGPSLSSWL